MELMNEESELFLSHFKGGIKYKHGGVGSGFKHVPTEEHVNELMRIKGKRYPRVFPVPIEAKQLCESDCYVLDLGDHIYNWYGSACTEHEKVAAVNYANDLKNHMRKMKAKLHFPQTMGGSIEEDFWKALGGSKADVQPPLVDEKEPEVDSDETFMYKLWWVHESEGKLNCEEVKERPLTLKKLKSEDTCILELFNKIYVW